MERDICIHHHLGLGDHFDMNGLVRYYFEKPEYDRVHVFAKNNTFPLIDYMYRDEENIVVVEIDSSLSEDEQVKEYIKKEGIPNSLRIGFENYPIIYEHMYNKNCWEFFYEQVEVPYEARAEKFFYERDYEEEERVFNKLNPTGEPFIFIHDDPARGFTLDRGKIRDDLKVVENDVSENIFHFTKVLEEAKEIHCMESSFKSLIDFHAGTDKIYYHELRKHPLGERSNKNWEIIKYD